MNKTAVSSMPLPVVSSMPSPISDPSSSNASNRRVLARRHSAVEAGQSYSIHLSLLDLPERTSDKAAAVTVAFLDQHGNHMDSRIVGCQFSSALQKHYFYQASYSSVDAVVKAKQPILAPAGATHVELTALQWKSSSSLRTDGEFVVVTYRDLSSQLSELYAQSPDLAQAIATQMIDQQSVANPDTPALAYLIDFARSVGSAALMQRAAAFLFASSARGTALQQARNALAELETLNPAWEPVIRGEWPAPQRRPAGNPRRVAHLCGARAPTPGTNDGKECPAPLALSLALQQRAAGDQPFLITPTGYLVVENPAAPSEQSSEHDIPWFRLRWLATKALASVERTHLIELDTLLCARVLHHESADLLHVYAGAPTHDLALRAMALAKALHLPWIYDLRESPLGNDSQGNNDFDSTELGRLQQQRNIACMRAANALITDNEPARNALIEAGIDASKILLVKSQARHGPLSSAETASAMTALYDSVLPPKPGVRSWLNRLKS